MLVSQKMVTIFGVKNLIGSVKKILKKNFFQQPNVISHIGKKIEL
jgi:hypothetical protein